MYFAVNTVLVFQISFSLIQFWKSQCDINVCFRFHRWKFFSIFICEKLTRVRKECTIWLNATSQAEITFLKHSSHPPLQRDQAALHVLSQKQSGSAPSERFCERKKQPQSIIEFLISCGQSLWSTGHVSSIHPCLYLYWIYIKLIWKMMQSAHANQDQTLESQFAKLQAGVCSSSPSLAHFRMSRFL